MLPIMKVAVMAIGLPGSGKTTLLKPLARTHSLVYINRDDIREELLGKAHEQSRNKEVWEEANRRTASALESGAGVVLDATFVERWKRQSMLSFLRAAGAEAIFGIYFDVPLRTAQERNRGRELVVPDSVMEWMHQKLTAEPPRDTEGFDALYDDVAALEQKLVTLSR